MGGLVVQNSHILQRKNVRQLFEWVNSHQAPFFLKLWSILNCNSSLRFCSPATKEYEYTGTCTLPSNKAVSVPYLLQVQGQSPRSENILKLSLGCVWDMVTVPSAQNSLDPRRNAPTAANMGQNGKMGDKKVSNDGGTHCLSHYGSRIHSTSVGGNCTPKGAALQPGVFWHVYKMWNLKERGSGTVWTQPFSWPSLKLSSYIKGLCLFLSKVWQNKPISYTRPPLSPILW